MDASARASVSETLSAELDRERGDAVEGLPVADGRHSEQNAELLVDLELVALGSGAEVVQLEGSAVARVL